MRRFWVWRWITCELRMRRSWGGRHGCADWRDHRDRVADL